MSPWLLGLVIVSLIMVARGFSMLYLFWRVGRAHAAMHRYWNGELEYEAIAHRKRDIVRLLRAAHIESPRVPRAEPIGLGQMVTGHFGVFDNLFRRDGDIVMLVNDALMEAAGYYRSEARRSFVPVFWPSVLAHLPSDFLVYVGVGPESAAARIATAIGWIATVVAGVAAFIDLLG
jgi:hypothetical protein